MYLSDSLVVAKLSIFELGNGNPLQYSCLENPMEGGKESDRAERLHIHFHPEPGFLEAEASEAVNLL